MLYKYQDIKNYFLTFSITKEEDIFLLFDYFSNQLVKYDSLLLKDFMVVLVKAYKNMDNRNKAFNLIIEESELYLYVTVHNDMFVQTMQKLVSHNSILFQYAKNNNAFSFRIDTVSSTQTKNIRNDLFQIKEKPVSAQEFMLRVSSDILKYVEEINYKLHEYRALCKQTNSFNHIVSMTLINLLEQYIILFQRMDEFENICIALKNISTEIRSCNIHNISEVNNKNLIKYFNALNSHIEDWITSVIINKISGDVHYNDYNIISSCKLIKGEFGHVQQ